MSTTTRLASNTCSSNSMLWVQQLGSLETDPDTFRGITRMYVEAGEAWVVLIAHEPEKYEFIVRAVAQCTEYNEDLEVTKITFNFWYELTQLITVDKYRQAKELFTAVYAGLVDTMISHILIHRGAIVQTSSKEIVLLRISSGTFATKWAMS